MHFSLHSFGFSTDDVGLEYTHPKTKERFDLRPVFESVADLERWAVAKLLNVNRNELTEGLIDGLAKCKVTGNK